VYCCVHIYSTFHSPEQQAFGDLRQGALPAIEDPFGAIQWQQVLGGKDFCHKLKDRWSQELAVSQFDNPLARLPARLLSAPVVYRIAKRWCEIEGRSKSRSFLGREIKKASRPGDSVSNGNTDHAGCLS
jgi:hypothetical protein